MIGSLYRSREYLTPSSILYLYKSQIRPTMEYCCHIWAGASRTSLKSLDGVQKRLRWLVGDELFSTLQPLSQRRDVASLALLYRYFHGECSEELQAMVPPVKVFPRNTRLASSVKTNHRYFLDIPFINRQFHAASFFPRTAQLWNELPFSCFPVSYNLNLFKSRINRYLSSLSPPPHPRNPRLS